MENKIYLGNIVSFVETSYFIKLITIKENALLYKVDKDYIDVTDIDNIEEYVNFIKENDKSKILHCLPVYKEFIDEKSLRQYIKHTKKLTR